MIKKWCEITQKPLTMQNILNQQIWHNSFIKVNNLPIKKMFNFNLFVNDIVKNGKLMSWTDFKAKFNLNERDFFKWSQIRHAIPEQWKSQIRVLKPQNISNNPTMHLLHLTRQIPISELTSKMLYTTIIHANLVKPSSQEKIENKLNTEIDWPQAYTIVRQTTLDSYSRFFHFKCTHNILYLNEVLYKMKLVTSPLCSYCKRANESVIHLFSECENVVKVWREVQNKFQNLNLPNLNPGNAILGLIKQPILNRQIHLIFRIAIYNNREKQKISINYISNKIDSIRRTEDKMTFYNEIGRIKNTQKWLGLNQIE